MNPANNLPSFINPADYASLINLSKVKGDNQVIDVYPNGRISEPYIANSWSSSLWRTTRFAAGISGNSDDIPKIAGLINRVVSGFVMSEKNQRVERLILEAIKGLEHLQKHYKNAEKVSVAEAIGKILENSLELLTTAKNSNVLDLNKFLLRNFVQYNSLEASSISQEEAGSYATIDAINFYRDRIKVFMILKENKLNKDENQFFSYLDAALESVVPSEDIIHQVNRQVCKKVDAEREMKRVDSEPGLIWGDAIELVKGEIADELINNLDSMSPQQAKIGIMLPMKWLWNTNEYETEGHVFLINLSREESGSYKAAQINAGGLSIGEITGVALHMNYNVPLSLSLKPVVEFTSLNREEAVKFLYNVKNNSTFPNSSVHLKSRDEAQQKYRSLFEPIIAHKAFDRIPTRRSQTIGNCGIRSFKESLIYFFQLHGHIILANEFFTFQDTRGSETLEFEKIRPLKRLK